jgi:hypothetical protein
MSQQQRIDVNRFFEWSKSYHFRQSCDPENVNKKANVSDLENQRIQSYQTILGFYHTFRVQPL